MRNKFVVLGALVRPLPTLWFRAGAETGGSVRHRRPPAAADLPLNLIKLPPGFAIDVYASGVPNAREMALGPKGTVFVGSRNKPAGD